MTRAVGDDDAMLKSLQEVVALFKEAQQSVFKLMSSVCCPTSDRTTSLVLIHTLGFGTQVPQGAEVFSCIAGA